MSILYRWISGTRNLKYSIFTTLTYRNKNKKVPPTNKPLITLLILLNLPPFLRHPNQPIQENGPEKIKDNVNKKQPNIAPLLRGVNTQRQQKIVGRRHLAEATVSCRPRVQQVSSSATHIRLQVAGAVLS